jgi:Domain of Unknown Function (DUF1080)
MTSRNERQQCLMYFNLILVQVLCCLWLLIPRAVGSEKDWRPLFNGRDLTGWVREGNAGFSIDSEGSVVCTGEGNYPSWLRSEREYENFEMEFEFRLENYGEGGVFLHAPLHGRSSNVGFEIQLSDDSRHPGPCTASTGAVFGAVPPRAHYAAIDVWNRVQVRFDWPRLQVIVNDQVVQDLNCEKVDELRYRKRSGYLGFQDRGKPTWYRNVRIRELPGREHWQNLFNGRDLTGWNRSEAGDVQWSMEGDAIVARNGNGYLITEERWRDFAFESYVQASPLANGGIFFRWNSLTPVDRGYEIQIEDIPDSNNPTGSVYDVARASDPPITPGEWYLLQLFVRENTAVVRVNGKTVAHTDRLTLIRDGHIALQMHNEHATIRFKGLRIISME